MAEAILGPTKQELVDTEEKVHDYSDVAAAACRGALDKAKKLDTDGRKKLAEELLGLEKKARQGADAESTALLVGAIVDIFFEAREWDQVINYISICCKRRSQMKKAMSVVVEHGMAHLEHAPDRQTKLDLIDVLRVVSEGRIFLEVKRARLTHMLSKMKEEDGDIPAAALLMQSLQIETYGTMDAKEKAMMILEQMRLCIANGEYLRAHIQAQKMSMRKLNSEEFEDEKIMYYRYIVQYHEHEKDYLAATQAYLKMYHTNKIMEDSALAAEVLKLTVIYAVLSAEEGHQRDVLERIWEISALSDEGMMHELVKMFRGAELIHWRQLTVTHAAMFEQHPAFRVKSEAASYELASGHRALLKKRVVEHNLRVVAKCYSRITLRRLETILDLSPAETEDRVAGLVQRKTIFARIDRPAGVCVFRPHARPEAVLNAWAQGTSSLLSLVDSIACDISREYILHADKVEQEQ